jgi:hypothetical protein
MSGVGFAYQNVGRQGCTLFRISSGGLIYGETEMRSTSRGVTMYDILAMTIALSLLAAAVAPMVRRLNLLG